MDTEGQVGSNPMDSSEYLEQERNVLVLNTTLACVLQCDFCCYHCHPKRKERMPKELAVRLVQEAAAMKDKFSCVGLTGGEPMLYPDDVLEIGDHLRRLQMPFTLATAGHWGPTREQAEDMVGRLADRGLSRLNISHDPSHAEYVPREYVINLAKAASQRQIPTYVVGTMYDVSQGLEHSMPELVDVPYVKLMSKLVAKVGRASASEAIKKPCDMRFTLGGLSCYRKRYHDLVVFWDGSAYPCCSTYNRATPGLLLGNANERSLQDLFERAEGSLRLQVMKRQSFEEMYEIVKKYDPALHGQLPQSDDAMGPCSLCNRIFANEKLSTGVNDAFTQYEQEKISRFLEMLTEKIGATRADALLGRVLRGSAAVGSA